MARRERERYTERARSGPSRAKSAAGGISSDGDSVTISSTPIMMLALGTLVLGGILALGVWFTRQSTPAGTGTPTAATEAMTDTNAAAPTVDTGAAAGVTDTTGAPAPSAEGKSFPNGPEDQKLDAKGKAYFATIETQYGPIVMELWPDVAPQHVNSFVFLAKKGFFDGLTFHRVEPGFVIQGGDPQGTGMGGPGYSVPAEFNADKPVPHRKGTLAMARSSDPNSAGSQFYIVTADGPGPTSLDGQYTVFGHVIKGMDAVLKVKVGDIMSKVTIEEKPIADRVVSPDDIRAGKLPENN